jgi:hypothetical protein
VLTLTVDADSDTAAVELDSGVIRELADSRATLEMNAGFAA